MARAVIRRPSPANWQVAGSDSVNRVDLLGKEVVHHFTVRAHRGGRPARRRGRTGTLGSSRPRLSTRSRRLPAGGTRRSARGRARAQEQASKQASSRRMSHESGHPKDTGGSRGWFSHGSRSALSLTAFDNGSVAQQVDNLSKENARERRGGDARRQRERTEGPRLSISGKRSRIIVSVNTPFNKLNLRWSDGIIGDHPLLMGCRTRQADRRAGRPEHSSAPVGSAASVSPLSRLVAGACCLRRGARSVAVGGGAQSESGGRDTEGKAL